MKGAVVQSPETVTVLNIPDPIIDEYDVLCEMLASAVCSGTDNNIVRNDPYHKVSYPTILGHEGIGRVLSCGSKVKHYKVGDLITRIVNKLPQDSGYSLHHGAFAEKGIATDWQAMRDDGIDKKVWQPHTIHRVLPKDFDPIQSTMIITWRETYSFLSRMNPEKEDVVLVIGSGANALAFTDHARNLNLKTIIIGSPERADKFLSAGAEMMISYHEDILAGIKKSGFKKIDIIIDAIGKSDGVNEIISTLTPGGKIGVYGLNDFLDYKISVGKLSGDFHYYNGEHYDEGSAHDDIVNYIKKGKLNAWDYLSQEHIYPLEKINEALEASRARKVLKSVIKF